MKRRNKKLLLLFALALMVVFAAAQIPATLSYFTDTDQAVGHGKVDLSWQTKLHEEIRDNNKHITVENTGDTDAVVRVAVYAGDFVKVSDGDGNWKHEGDWWYYKKILAPGETTTELLAEVTAEDAPDYDFNVVVVHESFRAVYEDNDTLRIPAGWDYAPGL